MDTQTKLIVSGRVQAVGYRFWSRRVATKLGLSCTATNLPDGTVELTLIGPEAQTKKMIQKCWQGPPLAQVENVRATSQNEEE